MRRKQGVPGEMTGAGGAGCPNPEVLVVGSHAGWPSSQPSLVVLHDGGGSRASALVFISSPKLGSGGHKRGWTGQAEKHVVKNEPVLGRTSRNPSTVRV